MLVLVGRLCHFGVLVLFCGPSRSCCFTPAVSFANIWPTHTWPSVQHRGSFRVYGAWAHRGAPVGSDMLVPSRERGEPGSDWKQPGHPDLSHPEPTAASLFNDTEGNGSTQSWVFSWKHFKVKAAHELQQNPRMTGREFWLVHARTKTLQRVRSSPCRVHVGQTKPEASSWKPDVKRGVSGAAGASWATALLPGSRKMWPEQKNKKSSRTWNIYSRSRGGPQGSCCCLTPSIFQDFPSKQEPNKLVEE